jgi:hypothetical protein
MHALTRGERPAFFPRFYPPGTATEWRSQHQHHLKNRSRFPRATTPSLIPLPAGVYSHVPSVGNELASSL